MKMPDNIEIRKQILKGLKRVVIKIGSSVISNRKKDKAGLACGLCQETIQILARKINLILKNKCKVTLVSSGAIMAGRNRLGLDRPHLTIPEKQACAAVGQSFLVRSYEKAFDKYGVKVAQILLDHQDLVSRKRYLNAKNTLDTLMSHNVVPIVNENDTVSVDEIKIGDNDTLSADVACLLDAQLLIILSDVEGLFTGDPTKPTRYNQKHELIPLVTQITPELEHLAGNSTNQLTVGGMEAKVRAAKKTMSFGIPTLIISGIDLNQLPKVFEGKSIGTLFWAEKTNIKNRKHWIAHTLKPAGGVVIDSGAKKALLDNGKSLLPAGVIRVEGEFQFGNAVCVYDDSMNELARGLINYNSVELNRIKGMKTQAARKMMGEGFYDEVIHRDDLVVS